MAKIVEEKFLYEQKEGNDRTGQTLEVTTREETEMNFSFILATEIRRSQSCQ
jgi:hypothetical protein